MPIPIPEDPLAPQPHVDTRVLRSADTGGGTDVLPTKESPPVSGTGHNIQVSSNIITASDKMLVSPEASPRAFTAQVTGFDPDPVSVSVKAAL